MLLLGAPIATPLVFGSGSERIQAGLLPAIGRLGKAMLPGLNFMHYGVTRSVRNPAIKRPLYRVCVCCFLKLKWCLRVLCVAQQCLFWAHRYACVSLETPMLLHSLPDLMRSLKPWRLCCHVVSHVCLHWHPMQCTTSGCRVKLQHQPVSEAVRTFMPFSPVHMTRWQCMHAVQHWAPPVCPAALGMELLLCVLLNTLQRSEQSWCRGDGIP